MRRLAFSVQTLQQNANIGVVEPKAIGNPSAQNRNVRENSGNSLQPDQILFFASEVNNCL